MPEVSRRREWRASESALALFYVASSFGYVRSQAWAGAWLLALPVVAGLALSLKGISARLRRRGERDAWLLVGLAAVVSAGWTLYALVDERFVTLLRGVIGSGLVLMGAFFLAGCREWRPERGLIPSGLGMLVISALDPFASMTVPATLAALGVLTWLVLERPTQRAPGALERSPAGPLIALGALTTASAVGLGVLLPWAQPLVEEAAVSALSSGQAQAGLSGSSRLGDFESLALSREVVLRLWSDRPLKLRASVLTHFDGRRWTAPVGPARLLARLDIPHVGPWAEKLARLPGTTFRVTDPVPPGAAWARVLATRLDEGKLVAPRGPRLVRIAGGTPLADPAGVLAAPFWPPPRIYGLVHAPEQADPPTADERAAATQLPEELDPRLLALAQQLSSGAVSDRERIDRTRDWLGRELHYSLDVGAFRTGQPLAEFLFEKKRGYCEYFASAAALLLRLQGVPTRYVAGFNVRDQNRHGGYYLVRMSNAHAWIEAWVDGVGWVECDPTPAAQYDALRADQRDGPLARLWEAVAVFFAELSARFGEGPGEGLRWLGRRLAELAGWLLARAGGALIFALIAAAAWLGWRRWRQRSGKPRRRAAAAPPDGVDPKLLALLRDVEALWAALGHSRPAHRALLEHVEAWPESALGPAARTASSEVVQCYYRSRFGGRVPAAEELAHLQGVVDVARAENRSRALSPPPGRERGNSQSRTAGRRREFASHNPRRRGSP